MPFASEKQRRWMHANEPEMAARWEAEERKRDPLLRRAFGPRKRVVVTGSRSDDGFRVRADLDELKHRHGRLRVAEGGAKGADAAAAEWAERTRRVKHKQYRADWATQHRAAGPIRNRKMIDSERPDVVLAYPGGDRGTADAMAYARKRGYEVRERLAVSKSLIEIAGSFEPVSKRLPSVARAAMQRGDAVPFILRPKARMHGAGRSAARARRMNFDIRDNKVKGHNIGSPVAVRHRADFDTRKARGLGLKDSSQLWRSGGREVPGVPQSGPAPLEQRLAAYKKRKAAAQQRAAAAGPVPPPAAPAAKPPAKGPAKHSRELVPVSRSRELVPAGAPAAASAPPSTAGSAVARRQARPHGGRPRHPVPYQPLPARSYGAPAQGRSGRRRAAYAAGGAAGLAALGLGARAAAKRIGARRAAGAAAPAPAPAAAAPAKRGLDWSDRRVRYGAAGAGAGVLGLGALGASSR